MTLEQARQMLRQAHAIAPEQTEMAMAEVERIVKIAGTTGKRAVRVLGCLRALADALTVDE